jgi:phosphoribosylglycinamide formyltransferase-1
MSESSFEESKEKLSNQRARLLVFASGGGTNFQEIINRVESGEVNAEIVGLFSNKEEAYVRVRARNHNIPEELISSRGKLREIAKRQEFEKEILAKVAEKLPDIIVLAGWMIVLSDDFITKANQLGARIINLHPALLTEGNEAEIETTFGKIPVIRGANAIHEAYELNLPVSGVTVHEVVPGAFDTGPIILQEEVVRSEDETLESWETKIHQTEYRVLPRAIKNVILNLRVNP